MHKKFKSVLDASTLRFSHSTPSMRGMRLFGARLFAMGVFVMCDILSHWFWVMEIHGFPQSLFHFEEKNNRKIV